MGGLNKLVLYVFSFLMIFHTKRFLKKLEVNVREVVFFLFGVWRGSFQTLGITYASQDKKYED